MSIASSVVQGKTGAARHFAAWLERLAIISRLSSYEDAFIRIEHDNLPSVCIERKGEEITVSENKGDDGTYIEKTSVTFRTHVSGVLNLIRTLHGNNEGVDEEFAKKYFLDKVSSGYENGSIIWVKPDDVQPPITFHPGKINGKFSVPPQSVVNGFYRETIQIEPITERMLGGKPVITTKEGDVSNGHWLFQKNRVPHHLRTIKPETPDKPTSSKPLWESIEDKERTALVFAFALDRKYVGYTDVLVFVAGDKLVSLNGDVVAWIMQYVDDVELVCYGNNLNQIVIESKGDKIGFIMKFQAAILEKLSFIKEEPPECPVSKEDNQEVVNNAFDNMSEDNGKSEETLIEEIDKDLANHEWTIHELIGILDGQYKGQKISKKDGAELIRKIGVSKGVKDSDKMVFKNIIKGVLDFQQKVNKPSVPLRTTPGHLLTQEEYLDADLEYVCAVNELRESEDELAYIERFKPTGKSIKANALIRSIKAKTNLNNVQRCVIARHVRVIQEALNLGTQVPEHIIGAYPEITTTPNDAVGKLEEPTNEMVKAQEAPMGEIQGTQAETEPETASEENRKAAEEQPDITVIDLKESGNGLNVKDPDNQPSQEMHMNWNADELSEIMKQVPEISFTLDNTLGEISYAYDRVSQGSENIKEKYKPLLDDLQAKLEGSEEDTPYTQGIRNRISEIKGLEEAYNKACREKFTASAKAVEDEILSLIDSSDVPDVSKRKALASKTIKAAFVFEENSCDKLGLNFETSIRLVTAKIVEAELAKIAETDAIFEKMKPLSEKAQAIFEKLVEGLTFDEDKGESHRKIETSNGTFMAVHIELIGPQKYSIAHYWEQNGDLMRDPDVEFIVHRGKVYAVYFRQDGVPGMEKEILQYDSDDRLVADFRQQLSIASFAGQWMINIRVQQKDYFESAPNEVGPDTPPAAVHAESSEEKSPASQETVIEETRESSEQDAVATCETPDKEIAETAPMIAVAFKEGDRVRIKEEVNLPHLVGKEGTIKKVESSADGFICTVVLDEGPLLDPFEDIEYDPHVQECHLLSLNVETRAEKQDAEIQGSPPEVAEENPAFGTGDRVVIVSGAYNGRHGLISGLGELIDAISDKPRKVQTYFVTTDNGLVATQLEYTLEKEVSVPENVVRDIKTLDDGWKEPSALRQEILLLKRKYLSLNALSLKDPSKKDECMRLRERVVAKGKEYSSLWEQWEKQYPETAIGIREAQKTFEEAVMKEIETITMDIKRLQTPPQTPPASQQRPAQNSSGNTGMRRVGDVVR